MSFSVILETAGVRFVGAGLTALFVGALLVGEVILGLVGAGLDLLELGKRVQPLIITLKINNQIAKNIFEARIFSPP
jgi:hypothetical protein